VIILNAAKFKVTGKKLTDKIYHRHTFFPGGHKMRTLQEMLDRTPERVIEEAVKCMLPKNKQQDRRMKRLHVYTGDKHDHQAQKPIVLDTLR
jgi:large subunit ribosomal protein L13